MKVITLRSGKQLFVDNCDYDFLSSHRLTSMGKYPLFKLGCRTITVGKYLYLEKNRMEKNAVLLYKDGNRFNLQADNLIVTTRAAITKSNHYNGKIGKSGYRGICITNNRKYRVTFYKDRKAIHLGIYSDLEEAKQVYQNAKKEMNL